MTAERAQQLEEIEVTPLMVEAGSQQLHGFDPERDSVLATCAAIYRAMEGAKEPPQPACSAAGNSPIAQLRALSTSGKLDRWHACGENSSEISDALRLIPQVIEQLDRALAELRKG